MTFRSSALMTALAVLGLSELAPAGAQPQAPVRPRYGAFGNVFSPRPALGVQGAGAGNAPFINPIGPQVVGGQLGNGGGFVVPGQPLAGLGYPGQVTYGQTLPGVFAVDPQLPATGVVGTFNNLGHWYPGATGGGLGHWYPNGLANGRGMSGGGGGGGMVGPVAGGGAAGMARQGGSALGTALGAGAAVNSFRK